MESNLIPPPSSNSSDPNQPTSTDENTSLITVLILPKGLVKQVPQRKNTVSSIPLVLSGIVPASVLFLLIST